MCAGQCRAAFLLLSEADKVFLATAAQMCWLHSVRQARNRKQRTHQANPDPNTFACNRKLPQNFPFNERVSCSCIHQPSSVMPVPKSLSMPCTSVLLLSADFGLWISANTHARAICFEVSLLLIFESAPDRNTIFALAAATRPSHLRATLGHAQPSREAQKMIQSFVGVLGPFARFWRQSFQIRSCCRTAILLHP